MNGPYKAFKISDDVFWVGAIDWALTDFHGYSTRGSTYNAYLILADKVTLLDTVKASHIDEMLSRIASVIEPSRIAYIVSHHSEMDHTGALPEVLRHLKPEKIFASAAGVSNVGHHFRLPIALEAVGNGQKLSLGNRTLTFVESKMLHWPDSMGSFLEEEGIFFSQDIFGMHWASSERYADEIDPGIVAYEGAKYFANIFMPYSKLMAKFLERNGWLRARAKIIAPDHGPIWRQGIDDLWNRYLRWAEPPKTNRALIAYDTMWGSTAMMATAIADGISSTGALAKVMPLSASHRSDIATEILGASALLVGSSTLNGQMLPRVGDLLTYLRGLKPGHLLAGAFGSYGWHPKATGLIEETFKEMGLEILADKIESKFVPTQDDLDRCFVWGKSIGERLNRDAKASP